MADIKDEKKTTTNEEQNNNESAEKKEPGKVKVFFKKHASKIKSGLLVAGGLAAGVLADRAGIRLGGRKKNSGEDPGDSE